MIMAFLENGKTLQIEYCGDNLHFTLYAENGEYEKDITWDCDSIADMVFDD